MIKRPDIPPHYYIRRLSLKMEREGRRIIHFELGEPDLDTDKEIIEEMYRRALEGHTHYGSIYGIPRLRRVLAEYVNSILGLDFTMDNVIAIPGSKISLFLLFYTFLRGGRNKVLILTPTWGVYLYLIDDMGLDAIKYKLRFEDGWILRDEDIDNINEFDYDALVVVNPNNPTGSILPRENVRALTEISMDKDAYIFADEVYFDIIYGDNRFYSFLQEGYDKAIGIYSFSKIFAMTGFRLGWIVASNDIIESIARKMQLMFTNIPVFIQYAGIKAMSMPWVIRRNRGIYERRTRRLTAGLRRIGIEFVEPKASIYVFPKVPDKYSDGFEFAYRLLEEKGVTVAPGSTFGDYPRFFRMCTAISEEAIDEGIELMEEFLAK